jgi:hypothetical protein
MNGLVPTRLSGQRSWQEHVHPRRNAGLPDFYPAPLDVALETADYGTIKGMPSLAGLEALRG